MKTKSVLITDLDNTLFDWLEAWYQSFSAMLDVVITQTQIDRAQLIAEIKAVHQHHATSEYAFLLEETPSLRKFAGSRAITEVFGDAIGAFRSARRDALKLYPGVSDTLHDLKQRGCAIVAYTDSPGYYSGFRIRELKLDGIIDILYSPMNHDLPGHLTEDEISKHSLDHREFEITAHHYTPRGEFKPNPHILQQIISSLGVEASDSVYVGDSLQKDIAMAKDAGIDHAWAKYGVPHYRPEYQLLRDVTHWSDEDVERERQSSQREVSPDLALENEFSQIRELFEFRAR